MASYIARNLEKQEYTVNVEPKIETDEGIRKPDIVAKRGETALIIDAQIVNDQIDLDEAHKKKAAIYRSLTSIIKTKYQVQEVKYTSVTLSWRGLWSKTSARELLDFGVIRKNALKVISFRVVVGGLAAYHQFNRTTAVQGTEGRRRTGRAGDGGS